MRRGEGEKARPREGRKCGQKRETTPRNRGGRSGDGVGRAHAKKERAWGTGRVSGKRFQVYFKVRGGGGGGVGWGRREGV